MLAYRISTGQVLAPFGDPVGEAPVGNVPLARRQEEALAAAGLELVPAPPTDAPYLAFTDRCWFTPRLAATLAAGPPGRPRWTNQDFLRDAGPFQPDRARPELALLPAGAPPVLAGPDHPIDVTFHAVPLADPHPAFAHAQRGPFVTGPRLAHAVVHWSDLLRANLLWLSARAEEAREDWELGSLGKRLGMLFGFLGRAGLPTRARLARALGREGKRNKIHPTAILEACDLGDDVEIGPYCVLRGCVLGNGVRVDAFSTANLSLVGDRARLARGAMLNLSVLYPGAFVSEGGGYQACVIGRDAFCAKTATVLDLSFGRPVRSPHDGALVDTEVYFLGAAVGHRTKLGAGVRVIYGAAIPNDLLLVAPPEHLFRSFPAGIEGAVTVRDGVTIPVGRSPGAS